MNIRMLWMSMLTLIVGYAVAGAETISGACNLQVLYGQTNEEVQAEFLLDIGNQELKITEGDLGEATFDLIDVGEQDEVIIVGISSDLQAEASNDRGVYTAILNRKSGALTINFTRDGELSQDTMAGLVGNCFRSLM